MSAFNAATIQAPASAIKDGMAIDATLYAAFLQGLQSGYQIAKLEERKEAS